MRVVVTGATGFLGSHLVLECLKLGVEVIGFDNFSSSKPHSPHANAVRSKATFEECDITDPADVGQYGYLFERGGRTVDVIYNLACPASPRAYRARPVETLLASTIGAKNMLDVARKYKARFVQASTSEVYGDALVSPQPESYLGNVHCYGPRACYDEGKRAAEALCFDYRREYRVDARVARLFNSYGPHMDPLDGRVIPNFLGQALSGREVTVYGDGLQTRSFCYVDDTIRGLILLSQLASNPETPVNIGSDREVTVLDLAKQVQLRYGIGGILFQDKPVDDPVRRCPDITLAKRLLEWEPRIDLEEGLERTAAYLRAERGAP